LGHGQEEFIALRGKKAALPADRPVDKYQRRRQRLQHGAFLNPELPAAFPPPPSSYRPLVCPPGLQYETARHYSATVLERGRTEGIKMAGTVGIIGLGIMGGAISKNLIERGWRVFGTDLDVAKQAALTDNGGVACPDIASVCQQAPVLLTSLPSPHALATVAAAIAASPAARIVIEASTMALTDKLAAHDVLAASGHTALDCTLSGTGAQAANRDLVVYASGDTAAIAALMPLFADFARAAHDIGTYGNGSRMKYVANLLVAIHNVAAAEAMVLANAAGLDPAMVVQLAGAGAGASRMFDMRAPMMAAQSYTPATMRVSTWQKDMAIIGAFARDLGLTLPLFQATMPIYTAAMEAGLGDHDTAAVFAVLDKPQNK
jgi:putative dehydrogenase